MRFITSEKTKCTTHYVGIYFFLRKRNKLLYLGEIEIEGKKCPSADRKKVTAKRRTFDSHTTIAISKKIFSHSNTYFGYTQQLLTMLAVNEEPFAWRRNYVFPTDNIIVAHCNYFLVMSIYCCSGQLLSASGK